MADLLASYHICWVCGGEFPEPFPHGSESVRLDCTTCGVYTISMSQYFSSFPPEVARHRLSYWTKQHQLEGRKPPHLTSHSLPAIIAVLPDPRTHQKPDLLLLSLARLHPEPGRPFAIDAWRERSLACALDEQEMRYYLGCLSDRQHLQGLANNQWVIRPQGWEAAARLLDKTEASNVGFVAMAFREDMLALYREAFAPAIVKAGFEPHLANDPPHNDQIDARIVTELKRCRFLVADVTGANTGVYFEAGYALGFGRPVIWTCREGSARSDMHFDTRQYNHILWRDAAHLAEELYYRIEATI
ncbi:MAG TPA: hypothetical protein VN660_01735 [Steroidobacteraceae bacterium]|nr:hypothetical protein [Steroidobacteraceae bacterium]